MLKYLQQYATMRAETLPRVTRPSEISVDEVGVGQLCSRVLDVADLEDQVFLERSHELQFSRKNQHRKDWEKTVVSLLVDHFGLAKDEVACLGLGVGKEVLLFHFTKHCGSVVGIDLYRSAVWDSAALAADDVYEASPFPYRRERLTIRHMDMRNLKFEPASFDFVWSISSVEHVGTISEVVQVFREIERVLRPGGHAFITTEWNLLQENPRYVHDCIIFDDALVNHLMVSVPRLSLVGPIKRRQSDSPLHAYHINWRSNINTEIRPLYNIFTGGTFATPIVLVVRKNGPSPSDMQM